MHHIKLNNRNKKVSLQNIISKLNEYDGKCIVDEEEDEYDYLLPKELRKPREVDDYNIGYKVIEDLTDPEYVTAINEEQQKISSSI